MNNSISYPAVWRRLPPVPGNYLAAYYWHAGKLTGAAYHMFVESQIKWLVQQPDVLYFVPIPVAELLEDANVHV